jgi:phosphohistidine phosphatase SixA
MQSQGSSTATHCIRTIIDAYLDLIASAGNDTVRSLMIIGHNPMLEDTAQALLQDDPASFETALGSGFPTAGLLIVDCGQRGINAVARRRTIRRPALPRRRLNRHSPAPGAPARQRRMCPARF